MGAQSIPLESLPEPRLQFRWKAGDRPGLWRCIYELVLPLREHDIRRERYNAATDKIRKRKCLRLKISETQRDSQTAPCSSPFGEPPQFDAPFRDGAHAKWDSEALKGLPIYCIAPDGTAYKSEATP